MDTGEAPSAAERLADETGMSVERFSADGIELPEFEDLESVPEEEW